MEQLYLDCDGVLADFDRSATDILGCAPGEFEERHGAGKFWAALKQDANFYRQLKLLPDAVLLIESVRHLKPIILTGYPPSWKDSVTQKMEWVRRTFGQLQPVIVCESKHKSLFCRPGDVLIDDRPHYRGLWESAGGRWIHHTSAEDSITQLAQLSIWTNPPK